ncbi:hypothetical protein [Variovorax sp. LT1R16]|uniref:hypothetical protein n=1 Tax=Variovorax sp. LT1R16 TaxID=3443728 RepID=UPI003F446AD0
MASRASARFFLYREVASADTPDEILNLLAARLSLTSWLQGSSSSRLRCSIQKKQEVHRSKACTSAGESAPFGFRLAHAYTYRLCESCSYQC